MHSLMPIDVGFCPRLLKMTILLPADVDAIRYRWNRANRIARGSAETIARELRATGLPVVIVPAGSGLSFRRAK